MFPHVNIIDCLFRKDGQGSKLIQVVVAMVGCVFCEILRDEAPASLVYSDDEAAAFMDTQPVNPGHVLVVPKAHVAFLSDLDEETGGHMFKVAIRIGKALRKTGLRCEGLNLHLADGQVAGQEVFHVHLHVIPRFKGDGFGLKFGVGQRVRTSRLILDDVAGRIRDASS